VRVQSSPAPSSASITSSSRPVSPVISVPAASQADRSSSAPAASAYLHGSSSYAPATVRQCSTVSLQQQSSTCRVLSLQSQHFIFSCPIRTQHHLHCQKHCPKTTPLHSLSTVASSSSLIFLTEISPSSSARGLKKVREKQHCHEKINTACNHFKPQSPVLENLYTHSSAHHSLHCYPPPKHTHTLFTPYILNFTHGEVVQ